MIRVEAISANLVKIIAPEKLKADDFLQIAPQIDFSHQSARANPIADRCFRILRLGEYRSF